MEALFSIIRGILFGFGSTFSLRCCCCRVATECPIGILAEAGVRAILFICLCGFRFLAQKRTNYRTKHTRPRNPPTHQKTPTKNMNPSFPWSKPWELFALRVLGYYGKESTRIRQALHIYRTCKDAANNPTLRRNLKSLPTNSFQTEHQLILVHIWIMHNRLLLEGRPGQKLNHEIFHNLWGNTERRMRLGAPELPEISFSKNSTDIQKMSFGAMVSYDLGLKIETDNDHDLASALFRNLWQHQDNTANEKEVYAMARWMRKEVQRTKREWTFDQILRNEFKFTLPRGFGPETRQDRWESERLGLTGQYKCELDIRGRPYWWDVNTRETYWQRPDASKFEQQQPPK